MVSKATKPMAKVHGISEVDSQARSEERNYFEDKLIVREDTPDTSSSSMTSVDLLDVNIHHFSSLQKLLQTTVWILRYANKFLKKEIDNGPITTTEIKKAKKLWDLFVQQESFSDTTRR